jgi:plastocyanin
MSRAKLVPVLLLLVVGLVTACGGSDDPQAGASSGSSTSAPAGEPTSAITIKDFAFAPVMATAKVGDTISVTDADDVTHTLTADDGSFDTGKLPKGADHPITLDSAGTFTYHCEIHSYMKGTIEVSG